MNETTVIRRKFLEVKSENGKRGQNRVIRLKWGYQYRHEETAVCRSVIWSRVCFMWDRRVDGGDFVMSGRSIALTFDHRTLLQVFWSLPRRVYH